MSDAGVVREPWTRPQVGLLATVLVVAATARLAVLPTPGFRDDLDQFVGWVHHIAVNGLGSLYGETAAGPVTFGPVMGYLWAALAAIEPRFMTVTDGSDETIRVLMKMPAVLADVGLALMVAYALPRRPRWTVVGAAAILLHPAVIDIGAWWGQYESVFMVSALAAAILAAHGRNGWAAAAIAISVMTKPQALPLLLPLAAWFWAAEGWRGVIRGCVIGGTTALVLWLPYLAAGGPLNYLRNLDTYQTEIFNVLSLRAWNAWWLVQEAAAGGGFIADDVAWLGPVTARHLGYAIAGGLSFVVAVAIIRDPRPRTLFLGLASTVLIVFSFATQMHERYAFGALVFVALLVAEPSARWLGLAFGIVFTLNLLAAIPPNEQIGALLPVAGVLGITGSIAMLAITYATVRMLAARPTGRDAVAGPPGP